MGVFWLDIWGLGKLLDEPPHGSLRAEDGAGNMLRHRMGSPERCVSSSGAEATGHAGGRPNVPAVPSVYGL